MKSLKFYKSLSLVLFLVNVGVLVFFWVNRPPHPHERILLSELLELKGQVKNEVDIMEKQHHIEKRRLIKEDKLLHKRMMNSVGSGKTFDSFQVQLSANKSKIERMTFEFFDDITSKLDSNQRIKLKAFINSQLEIINGFPPKRK